MGGDLKSSGTGGYRISRDGAESGPFPADEVIDLIGSGRVAPSDLARCEGMSEWQRIEVIPQFSLSCALRSVQDPKMAVGGQSDPPRRSAAVESFVKAQAAKKKKDRIP